MKSNIVPENLITETSKWVSDLIREAETNAKAHLEWLKAHPGEADRDQQIAECERVIRCAPVALSIVHWIEVQS
jgi:hypothetical protein